MQERARISYASLGRVETKVSTLFAGTIAVVGFVLSKESTVAELLVVVAYLAPLALLMAALGVREYSIVPDAETLAKAWPYYPRQTVTALFEATKIAVEELSENVALKAKQLRQATRWLYALTAVVVILRLFETAAHALGVTLPAPYASFIGLPTMHAVSSNGSQT